MIAAEDPSPPATMGETDDVQAIAEFVNGAPSDPDVR